MNYFGVYHTEYMRTIKNVCDMPCISKGRMSLCAKDIASEGKYIAMADGRMRNRRELAERLGCSAGVSAASLVLRAYIKWGEEYPKYVEGPVATCVMNAGDDTMMVTRDRMGEKMMFYSDDGDKACFADHPDSLLKTASTEPIMNADGMRELFGIGPAKTPGRTPIKGIKTLEPGCALVLKEGRAYTIRYFSIESHPHKDDEKTTIEHTRMLIDQAIDEISGSNPAVMLSGGLDSTALTALLAQRNRNILSFSVDYRDNARDFSANAFRPEMDAPYIEQAVRVFKTQHRTIVLEQKDLASGLDRAVKLRGFPGMADIDSSLMLFAGHISRYARNVVSGECGDEVFCGYPWFAGDAELPDDRFPWSGSMELRESLLKPEIRETLRLREYVSDIYKSRVKAAEPDFACNEHDRQLKIMQKLCFEYFMSNLQERCVYMCEGAGVNVITPLCDDRLAAYVYNIPPEMKFMNGMEKGVFREAVSDLLPDSLLKRKKSPYPKTCSPVYGNIVRKLALQMISDTEAPIFEWIDREMVKRIVRSDLNPVDTPWFGQLMAGPQLLGFLWQVNVWMRDRNITVQL